MRSLIKYYNAAKEELAKVIFPLRDQVKTAFFSVTIIVSIMVAFLAIVDLLLRSIVADIIS